MQSGQDDEMILDKKYRVSKKLGSGSFGYIYACESLIKKQKYAVKIEKKDRAEGQLQYQIKLYQTFQGIPGIAKIYDYGYEGDKVYMVIDMLDKSLEDLFQANGKRLSLATVLQIGIQIITRLEAMHRKGFLHRDIKANNFMVGRKQKNNTVYIIDFGLAKRYRDNKTGNHVPFKTGKTLVGTARYASIASHLGHQQGRKDDLESLGFLLLYFLRGKLPWQGVQLKNKTQKYAQIGRIKKQSAIEYLVANCGQNAYALVKYFANVRSLNFTDEPKYDLLKKILRQELIKMNAEDQPLDWMKKKQ